MKALPLTMESNPNQAVSEDPSKRVSALQPGGRDNLYARLRRLEQDIVRLNATISTIRRDVYRIEKKQQREVAAPSQSIVDDAPDRLNKLLFE